MTGTTIGFTGTQRGMTPAQSVSVMKQMRVNKIDHFHHGDCIGADAQAHALARVLNAVIFIHPPDITTKRAFCGGDHEHRPAPYLVRNRHIVDACELLIAAPGEIDEQLRSGTWSTVRFARKGRRPIRIVFPDGSVKAEP